MQRKKPIQSTRRVAHDARNLQKQFPKSGITSTDPQYHQSNQSNQSNHNTSTRSVASNGSNGGGLNRTGGKKKKTVQKFVVKQNTSSAASTTSSSSKRKVLVHRSSANGSTVVKPRKKWDNNADDNSDLWSLRSGESGVSREDALVYNNGYTGYNSGNTRAANVRTTGNNTQEHNKHTPVVRQLHQGVTQPKVRPTRSKSSNQQQNKTHGSSASSVHSGRNRDGRTTGRMDGYDEDGHSVISDVSSVSGVSSLKQYSEGGVDQQGMRNSYINPATGLAMAAPEINNYTKFKGASTTKGGTVHVGGKEISAAASGLHRPISPGSEYSFSQQSTSSYLSQHVKRRQMKGVGRRDRKGWTKPQRNEGNMSARQMLRQQQASQEGKIQLQKRPSTSQSMGRIEERISLDFEKESDVGIPRDDDESQWHRQNGQKYQQQQQQQQQHNQSFASNGETLKTYSGDERNQMMQTMMKMEQRLERVNGENKRLHSRLKEMENKLNKMHSHERELAAKNKSLQEDMDDQKKQAELINPSKYYQWQYTIDQLNQLKNQPLAFEASE